MKRAQEFTVWITRPEPEAKSLCALARGSGWRVLAVPVIEIAPPVDPAAAQAHLRHIQAADAIIFISRNAVDWAFRFEPEIGRWLARRAVFAVGKATAAELARRGLREVMAPTSGSDSEALLDHPALSAAAIAGRTVLIVRGGAGRELLAQVLKDRGARVAYAEVYSRRLSAATARQLPSLWRETPPDIIVVTSSEALNNLLAVTPATHRKQLLACQLVVFGRQLAERVRRGGFQRPPVAAMSAGGQGMLEALDRAAELLDQDEHKRVRPHE
jgi:uroporphyrinogen-III synthase